MLATKALLTVKNINFVERHGVAGNRQPGNTNLENEQVTFHQAGILNALSGYLEDPGIGARHNHSFKDLLYNLPFIHRAFNLTFPTGYPEIYIPVEDAGFIIERPARDVRFHFKLKGNYATGHTVNKITPLGFTKNEIESTDKEFCMQSNTTIIWPSQANLQGANLNRLTDFHKSLRRQFQYIFGTKTLWYFKRTNVAHVVDKSPLTIMFACMHRLSELARYEPITLEGHFRLSQNWLLNEFIQGATHEFIDHISCEITNQKFMEPAIRK